MVNNNLTDDVFLITVASVDDPERQFLTFCNGSNELAYFLLHYNKSIYAFCGAEAFCPGNMLYWNYKDMLNEIPKKEKAQ